MNLLKPWRGIPELDSFPPAAQKRLWRDFETLWLKGSASNLTWVGAVYIFGVATIAAVILKLLSKLFGLEGPIVTVPIVAVLLAVGYFPVRVWIVGRLMRKWIRYHLHSDYENRIFPFCIQCGYILKGCNENAVSCPECGNKEIRGNPARAPDPADIIRF